MSKENGLTPFPHYKNNECDVKTGKKKGAQQKKVKPLLALSTPCPDTPVRAPVGAATTLGQLS